jgi:hypothetical protein
MINIVSPFSQFLIKYNTRQMGKIIQENNSLMLKLSFIMARKHNISQMDSLSFIQQVSTYHLSWQQIQMNL